MKKDLVIIINGAGTNSAELKTIYNRLAKNEDYFVYYPGFMPGSFVGNYFPKSTTKDFKRFIDETLEMVNDDFKDVYVIGYSLGACTTAILSSKTDRIKKIVLIAPIIQHPKYAKFLKKLSYALAFKPDLSRVQQIFYKEFLVRFPRVPKIHLWHLQAYLHFTKKYVKKIDKPTLIIETLQDEIVKKKSIDYLERVIKNEVTRVPFDSTHFIFFDKTVRKELCDTIENYLKEEL